jgi:hypothetical protein
MVFDINQRPVPINHLKKRSETFFLGGGKDPQYLMHDVSWAALKKATGTGILDLHYVAILQYIQIYNLQMLRRAAYHNLADRGF